jgi:transposase
MVPYLVRLSAVLNSEQPDWRNQTVFLMDGATYHKVPEVKITMKRLGINYFICAPYGYDAQPIEYLFGYFKQV